MIKNKNVLLIFFPAILIASLALFIRVIQYEPLYPDVNEYEKIGENNFTIPIYPEDPIVGNRKAPISIIAFEDFACQGCKVQFSLLEKLVNKHPTKLKIFWKGLPVSKFPHSSEDAHKYAFCVNEQGKFIEFYKLAFTNSDNLSKEILDIIVNQTDIKKDRLSTCLKSTRPNDHIYITEQLGMALNIQSVPTIFINNKQIESPSTISGWETLLGL